MAHGKQAARDLRYGRRGGRWAEGQPLDEAQADIDAMREKGIADGTWPGHEPEPPTSLFDALEAE